MFCCESRAICRQAMGLRYHGNVRGEEREVPNVVCSVLNCAFCRRFHYVLPHGNTCAVHWLAVFTSVVSGNKGTSGYWQILHVCYIQCDRHFEGFSSNFGGRYRYFTRYTTSDVYKFGHIRIVVFWPLTPCSLIQSSGVPRGGGWGVQTLLPKFRSFDKAAFDCKLSGKCLVFLFQDPNQFKNC